MKFPICFHTDDGKNYSGLVPDISGCYGAGDSLDAALADIEQAIHAHLELLAEDGETIPEASQLQDLVKNPDYAEGTWMVVDIDITPYLGKAKKINVTLPAYLIHQIENEIKENKSFKSRSQFLAEAALNMIHKKNNAA